MDGLMHLIQNSSWSHSADEVKQWFEEEGFTNIKLRMIKQNINMNGILE